MIKAKTKRIHNVLQLVFWSSVLDSFWLFCRSFKGILETFCSTNVIYTVKYRPLILDRAQQKSKHLVHFTLICQR
jgi:hypothetical protein